MPSSKTILICDTHIKEGSEKASDFFDMLNTISGTDHNIVFLGDIFDLWLALPRYETDIHRKFINWCNEQKRKRVVGFIEGNHEFFLTEEHKNNFTWCTSLPYYEDEEKLFTHGDLINSKDKAYRYFRFLVRNKVVKFLLKFMPFAPKLVKLVKSTTKKTNKKHRKFIPRDEIHSFIKEHVNSEINNIFVGHFHHQEVFKEDDLSLYLLPDWENSNNIAIYDSSQNTTKTGNYDSILSS